MNAIAIEITESTPDLFLNQSSLFRFDRDTTCGSGIEVEYAGSNGKLLYHRDADRMFISSSSIPALTATANTHYKGTGINPVFVHDETQPVESFGRDLLNLTKRISSAARRLLQLR